MFSLRIGSLLAAAALAFALPAAAQEADFFKGKTVTVYVGLTPGGGYDTNARLLAKYIGKYLPGNPNVIVQNLPGCGGLVMTTIGVESAPQSAVGMTLSSDLPRAPSTLATSAKERTVISVALRDCSLRSASRT